MHEVIIIGGGQAGLATAHACRRLGLAAMVVDDQPQPGGAWRHTWPSLHLFSPREASSLPGLPFPPTEGPYPTRDETIAYLTTYERRYRFDVRRPVRVTAVERDVSGFVLTTSAGTMEARSVVSATGTWSAPVRPVLPGRALFRGIQIHSAGYRGPEVWQGRSVIVVGGGNSAVQIVADLAGHARVWWCPREVPRWLPDDIDGRVLFEQASARYRAATAGLAVPAGTTLGDIVAVPAVRALRAAGGLQPFPPVVALEATAAVLADGSRLPADAIIWATGFGSALDHLRPLPLWRDDGRIAVDGTAATDVPGLYLVGYGNWTGYASATLVGVGRSARATAERILETQKGRR